LNALAQPRPDSSASPDPALLYAAIEALPASLAIVEGGSVVYANPAWARVFECSDPAQLQGRRLGEFIPENALRHATAEPNDGSEICPAGEFAHVRQDGARLHLQISCNGLRVRGKNFAVVNAHDVSGQKEIEKWLRESQKLENVGRLVGGVAHDFNNLLTGLMLYCDLLIGELEKDSRSRHHAQEMRRAGEQGAKLVQQLLAISRPSVEDLNAVALNDVVNNVEGLLTRLIGENVVLTKSLAGDLGSVRMDPAQVQQILLNLVLNARDAMPDGGKILLTTRNCAGYLPSGLEAPQLMPCVELAVSDTGSGMDAETLGRAFEPFFTTKENGRGNGLGLASARRLAKLHGGTILAESEPGRGTRISLLLPRVSAGTASDPTTSDSTRSDSTKADSTSFDCTSSDSKITR
jgi:PAS domain S-box-containing protein